MENITVLLLSLTNLLTVVVLILLILRLHQGIAVNVTLQQPKDPTAPQNTPNLQEIQESLDEVEKNHRENNRSLDEMVKQINEIMTGGTEDA